MSDQPRLKPCPAGHKAKIERITRGGIPRYYADCECDACGWMDSNDHDTEAAAIAAWNTRPTEDALRARAEEAETKLSDWKDGLLKRVAELRGVNTPCPACSGLGRKTYGDSSTWRGGIGGQTMTNDVCDTCWGSGDADVKWADLRELAEAKRKLAEAEKRAQDAERLLVGDIRGADARLVAPVTLALKQRDDAQRQAEEMRELLRRVFNCDCSLRLPARLYSEVVEAIKEVA